MKLLVAYLLVLDERMLPTQFFVRMSKAAYTRYLT